MSLKKRNIPITSRKCYCTMFLSNHFFQQWDEYLSFNKIKVKYRIVMGDQTWQNMWVGSGSGCVNQVVGQVRLGRVDPYFSNKFFFFSNYKNKLMTTCLERMNKIYSANEFHLMPLVNILQILTVLSMTKIIYSHKFMMEKVFNVNSLLSKCI